jgi:replication-associated recombination protein RarA
MPTFSQMVSVGGYNMGEVTSALQKSIRRGREEDAIFWATELDLSTYGEYCWKRLKIMASEDVGMADPNVAVQIQSLYAMWDAQKKKKDTYAYPERLFLVHAVMILANAPKSRKVDNALWLMYPDGENAREKREIPDYALDKHTMRGRQMKRGFEHFFEEGARLENCTVEDPYEARAREMALKTPTKPDDGELFEK